MTEFNDFTKLKKLVDDNGNLMSVSMEQLRDAHGAGRLGKYVVDAIKNALKSNGLDTFPEELPNGQNACVRVYAAGSPIAKLYTAMTVLEDQYDMDTNHERDTEIRDAVDTEKAEIISQIQQLVCA